MNLDVNTPRGQETLRDEERAVQIFERNFEGWTYRHTNKSGDAKANAFLFDANDVMRRVVETKCRYDLSLSKFQNESPFDNEWLLTAQKLRDLCECAKLLRCPAVGFLYLVQDDCLLIVRLCNDNGELLPNVRYANTRTQKTCNGGSTVRENAFIDMSAAKPYYRPTLTSPQCTNAEWIAAYEREELRAA